MPSARDTRRDVTHLLPLRPYCRATLWGRVVAIRIDRGREEDEYVIVELPEGVEPSPAAVHAHCRQDRWPLVSDWRPG